MQPEMTSPTSIRQGIDATNRRFEAAFNAGDPARAAREVYTRDARILPPGAPMIQGMEDIEQFWTAAAQQMGIRSVRLETLELSPRGESANEIGRATLELADGRRIAAKYVVIWERERGEWRWDVDIWNSNE